MYETLYKLAERPFELTANSKYLFLTDRQREALSTLQYGLLSAKSLTVLIGEAGTGKTTLLHAALESQRCDKVRAIYLNNPTLRTEDFISLLAIKLELGAEASASKAIFLDRLEALLLERKACGETIAIVVDEAQSLSFDLLEEIRLLANIETPAAKLLPLVLAGQPKLADRLEDPDFRQLKQRVTLRCEIEPFDLSETASYISTRISVAGGVPSRMFTREAVSVIHEYSGGIARTINVICDNALLTGMATGRGTVNRAHVMEVVTDLRLSARPVAESDATRSNESAASGVVASTAANVPDERIVELAPAVSESATSSWRTYLRPVARAVAGRATARIFTE